jgi:hypothetical protein
MSTLRHRGRILFLAALVVPLSGCAAMLAADYYLTGKYREDSHIRVKSHTPEEGEPVNGGGPMSVTVDYRVGDFEKDRKYFVLLCDNSECTGAPLLAHPILKRTGDVTLQANLPTSQKRADGALIDPTVWIVLVKDQPVYKMERCEDCLSHWRTNSLAQTVNSWR